MILCPHNSWPSPSCEVDGEGHGGAASRRGWRELGEEMHISEVWAGCFGPCGWSCTSAQRGSVQAGDLEECRTSIPQQSRCRVVPDAAPYGLQGWFCEDVSPAGSVCAALAGDSEPRIALLQLQFPPGRSRASRTRRWLPWAAHCPPWHRVRNVCAGQGRGIATQRKGKAASLFFLLQPLSHFSGWERQGPAWLKVTSSCCWPQASERESEQDTITRMSNTGSLPCRPGRVCRSTERDQQSRTSSWAKVWQSC